MFLSKTIHFLHIIPFCFPAISPFHFLLFQFVMYAKWFKQIGEAWDVERNDVGMAITLLDYLRQDILQQQMTDETKHKTDLLIELIDISIQHFSGDELIKITSGCTPCFNERNRKHGTDEE